jgi:hypothetical protein
MARPIVVAMQMHHPSEVLKVLSLPLHLSFTSLHHSNSPLLVFLTCSSKLLQGSSPRALPYATTSHANLRLKDCDLLIVITAPSDAEYAALGYVWGQQHGEGSNHPSVEADFTNHPRFAKNHSGCNFCDYSSRLEIPLG